MVVVFEHRLVVIAQCEWLVGVDHEGVVDSWVIHIVRHCRNEKREEMMVAERLVAGVNAASASLLPYKQPAGEQHVHTVVPIVVRVGLVARADR